MLSDRHVIELVRRTDPVPNVDDLPKPRLEATALLAVADKEGAENTVTDHPPTRPASGPSRRRRLRARLAFGATVFVVLAAIGVVGALDSGDKSPSGEATTTVATSTDAEGLLWNPVAGARGLESVRALVANCCQNVALGPDSWVTGWGESFTGPGARPIPPEIGRLHSIATNGIDMVAVPAVDPSITPYVATYDGTGRAESAWTTEALPTDVPSPHPDLVMHYRVWSVAHSGNAFAVYGWAQPEIDPAAIARDYPELAPVVQTNLAPPCCNGGPLTTEIADPLWVWTDDPSSEPTAISLSTFGLTRQDLQTETGVLWVFDRPSGPAPWVVTTALITEGVGPGWFLESGRTGGFVLLTGPSAGRYDAYTSPTGATWTRRESIPGEVVDLAVWEGRALVLTSDGNILGLTPEDTWASFADASTFALPDAEPANPVRIEAGDGGIVVVGEREKVLPWSGREAIPTAQVLWFSPDGSTWRHQELSDIFGDIGAVDILVTIHQGHREVPPTVIVALGVDQANGGPITDPQWWAARLAS